MQDDYKIKYDENSIVKKKNTSSEVLLVLMIGLEPIRAFGPRDFKSLASADSATSACFCCYFCGNKCIIYHKYSFLQVFF